ncbi:MAG: phosphatidylserine decarboxylase family protein [Bacteroidales bacterium]|nr:phosphatidylserine decarboxylase family protein [Bacteroidales bacterium]
MKIHRVGYKIILYNIAALAVINIAVIYFFSHFQVLWITVLSFSIIMVLFLVSFFRKPERKVTESPGKILSAADGKVVAIEEMQETEYFNEKKLQVSVFMSLFNVHYNTYPVSGTVKYVKYHPGKFLLANLPKSSVSNERISIVIETGEGIEIMIRQIAGFIARRIVTKAEPGMKVRQGDELGFIKFGSRVDIFLPSGTGLNVGLSQTVRANHDILAEL